MCSAAVVLLSNIATQSGGLLTQTL